MFTATDNRIVNQIARMYGDDASQEAAIVLMNCPADVTDYYRFQKAKWAAQHFIAKGLRYNKYVGEEMPVEMDGGDSGETSFDLIPDGDQTPEEMLETRQLISAVLSHLTERQQTVLKMVVVGMGKSEIAAELGIGPSAISNTLSDIRRIASQIQ